MAKTILFVPHNHFDPTWRRCFDRPAEYGGTTVRSYVEVEDHCITKWLELAPKGYTFSDGQAAIWRKYFERHPDKDDPVRQYARDGRLDVVLAGEVIQDSNLPAAEGLVRNFLTAWPFYREMVGGDHRGLKIAWVNDAFGNNPALPQMFKLLGADCVGCTTYRVCPGDVWTGIDGTSLFCFDWFPAVRVGQFEKHPPCEDCRGWGCTKCRGKGLRIVGGFDVERVRAAFEKAIAKEGDWCVVWITTEELVPDETMLGLIEELNRKHEGKACIRFGNPSDIYQMHLPKMRQMLEAKGAPPPEDLNPAMQGCYVSRIQCKQRSRAVAYGLIMAEAQLANEAWRNSQPSSPAAELAEAWRLVAFNQFHDAITGTHIDSAYAELMDMLDRAEKTARKYLPEARRKSTPKFAELRDDIEQTLKIGSFDVRFDRKGILSILRAGQDVFGVVGPSMRVGRAFRVAELVMEPDFGDAWSRRVPPMDGERGVMHLIRLGDYHQKVEMAADAVRWTGRYTGHDPMVRKLKWTVTMRLSEDGQRLDFVTDIDWDTASRRIRVLVPVASQDVTATYEIPFGFIDRTFDEKEINYHPVKGNMMDWPALHWVRKKIDERRGVAVLNKGLPCNRWMPGRLDLSLLRSPQGVLCAVEPETYEFYDIDGLRDAGKHRFEYSIWPYYDGLCETELTRAGYAYNMGNLIDVPFRISGDVIVTAWKLAEDGTGWILRLQETSGRGTTLGVDFDSPLQVTHSDLLERPLGPDQTARRYQAPLHKHEIITLRIR